ncbi:GIY-YIG nuclease family protein [Salinithrix halophila]|uniref:GIY-YIG nuclease family protein n=1 Tax=Salinithrix halophila TaxID=1485204 RepID=A0ABV8JCM6_9BACL
MSQGKNYVVYILECRDQTLYTGVTTDLERRLRQHRAGIGAKYTRGRSPLKLRLVEAGKTRSEALRLEREIKEMTRQQKMRLIAERGLAVEEAEKF